ncbi:MAG: catalase-related domain-containing protein, partial [Ferruginibacter sp.]
GGVSYQPNSIGNGCPFQAKSMEGGFTSYAERIDAKKIRGRSSSFFDHFSQATLFFNSQSEAEKSHIIDALSFELGKVERMEIRERMVVILSQVDSNLAKMVADNIGLKVPVKPKQPINQSVPADGNPKNYQPKSVDQGIAISAALSMANTIKNTVQTRQVAIFAADGVNENSFGNMKAALEKAGAKIKVISPKLGAIKGDKGMEIMPDQSFLTATSVVFDALYLPGGSKSVATLKNEAAAIHFINETYKHCKPIAADGEGIDLLKSSSVGYILEAENSAGTNLNDLGIITTGQGTGNKATNDFINAIAQHRFWTREKKMQVPA